MLDVVFVIVTDRVGVTVGVTEGDPVLLNVLVTVGVAVCVGDTDFVAVKEEEDEVDCVDVAVADREWVMV